MLGWYTGYIRNYLENTWIGFQIIHQFPTGTKQIKRNNIISIDLILKVFEIPSKEHYRKHIYMKWIYVVDHEDQFNSLLKHVS